MVIVPAYQLVDDALVDKWAEYIVYFPATSLKVVAFFCFPFILITPCSDKRTIAVVPLGICSFMENSSGLFLKDALIVPRTVGKDNVPEVNDAGQGSIKKVL